MPRATTLGEFQAKLPPERFTDYRRLVRDRLGIDLEANPSRKLDSSEVALLAGVQPGTVTQWKMRTRREETRTPWLKEDPTSYVGKALYDPFDTLDWLAWARKDPGNAGRPATRGPRSSSSRATVAA